MDTVNFGKCSICISNKFILLSLAVVSCICPLLIVHMFHILPHSWSGKKMHGPKFFINKLLTHPSCFWMQSYFQRYLVLLISRLLGIPLSICFIQVSAFVVAGLALVLSSVIVRHPSAINHQETFKRYRFITYLDLEITQCHVGPQRERRTGRGRMGLGFCFY